MAITMINVADAAPLIESTERDLEFKARYFSNCASRLSPLQLLSRNKMHTGRLLRAAIKCHAPSTLLIRCGTNPFAIDLEELDDQILRIGSDDLPMEHPGAATEIGMPYGQHAGLN